MWVAAADFDFTANNSLSNRAPVGTDARRVGPVMLTESGLPFAAVSSAHLTVDLPSAPTTGIRVLVSANALSHRSTRRSVAYLPGVLDLHVTSTDRVACALRGDLGWVQLEAPVNLFRTPQVSLLQRVFRVGLSVIPGAETALSLDLGDGWQSWSIATPDGAGTRLAKTLFIGANPVAHEVPPQGLGLGQVRKLELQWQPSLDGLSGKDRSPVDVGVLDALLGALAAAAPGRWRTPGQENGSLGETESDVVLGNLSALMRALSRDEEVDPPQADLFSRVVRALSTDPGVRDIRLLLQRPEDGDAAQATATRIRDALEPEEQQALARTLASAFGLGGAR